MNIFDNITKIAKRQEKRKSFFRRKDDHRTPSQRAADTLKTLGYAFVFAMTFRSLLFEPFHIPSSSMYPNLIEGDYVFVSKFTYGYSKYSFPLNIANFNGRFFQRNEPERGDIIVFRYPTNPRINYIKRVVGLPNDKVQMINGVLYINEKIVKRDYKGTYIMPEPLYLSDSEVLDTADEYEETLPDSDKSYITIDILESEADNTEIFTVPEDHYFFVGDNRDNSQDSRFMDHTGFVAKENLVGKAQIIFMSSEEPLWHFWKFYKMFRWNRFFTKLH